MAKAKYIDNEIYEIEAHKRYVQSIPKLPIEIDLHKSLPKALNVLSTEDCSVENTSKCNKELISLITPLLTNKDGKFIYMKDKDERETVKKALDFFVKIKVFRMLKEYHLTIGQIFHMNIFWIRDITTLELKSKSTYKQIKSILEHLFCKYEVPEFMFQAWIEKTISHKHQEWFLHLADGGSARELHKFPIPITKKMAHEFISTPFPGYSIDDAVRRAQVLSLGGDDRLANAILMSRLRNDFSNNVFWTTVIQFFVNIPMLNLDEVGAVFDYINEKKFVPKRMVVNGNAVYRAESPGFNMKGRNIETLIRDTHAWHAELNQLRRQAGVANDNTSYKPDLTSTWSRSRVKPFTFTEGKKEKTKIWTIKEITNAEELYDEGKSMSHCVYSYLSSCKSGTCTIFSLRLFGTSMVTIEVRNDKAVQIRGRHNTRPTDKELVIINNWAKAEFIEVTKYAVAGR